MTAVMHKLVLPVSRGLSRRDAATVPNRHFNDTA